MKILSVFLEQVTSCRPTDGRKYGHGEHNRFIFTISGCERPKHFYGVIRRICTSKTKTMAFRGKFTIPTKIIIENDPIEEVTRSSLTQVVLSHAAPILILPRNLINVDTLKTNLKKNRK